MRPAPTDVLVAIDMQNGFVSAESEHVVPVVVSLVEQWQAAGGAVVMTRYLNHPNSPYVEFMGWFKMQASPEIDIVAELQPYVAGSHVLDKTVYTAFTPDGVELFDRRGWKNVYIVGLDTESCVAQTAVGAFERHLRPVVITDGCASHAGQQAHDAGVFVMRRNLGSAQLTTSAELGLQVPLAS
ncbi:cysteine hydrolase family protein [Nocardiopsis sp. NRRL B-16309]|uniref:cysteine hydrolase family protein n=1 Tax=Nocardiopsis sp. NRRL B-16309 TaxID=1519494 RepID=UPI0006AE1F49|nr:isochorismatase family cysteine hydrolase [Nocardiopsis sp. NRRL B-16309]KOX11849.1 hydrolase [Nocardiopsis sp. NRRL B-16309]